jgi:hypothetical protein
VARVGSLCGAQVNLARNGGRLSRGDAQMRAAQYWFRPKAAIEQASRRINQMMLDRLGKRGVHQ